MATSQKDVSTTLIQLADTLVSDYELLDYLDTLLEHSTAVLDASAGGVMLTDATGRLQLLASTDEQMRLMELFELQRQEGPCIDAHRGGEPVIEEDLASSSRWPQLSPLAQEVGYRAAFAFPMRLRSDRIGALNLFRAQRGAVEPEQLRAAQAFADMAAIGILQARAMHEARDLTQQLQGALTSRIVLEQAKGIVAERAGCGMGEAFQLLRWYARRHNRGLRAVAAAVVARDLAVEELAIPGPPDHG